MGTAARSKSQQRQNATTSGSITDQLVCQTMSSSASANTGRKLLKHKRRYCRFEGCKRIVKSQGLCQRHGAKPKTCSVPGCTKQAQGNFDRMCKSHFKAMKRQTTPIPKVVASDSPPEPEGESVYANILPKSISFNAAAMARGEPMPLVAHLKHGFETLKPPAWHRNEERRARGIVQVENPATQLTGWERELVWMEILVLTGVPGASFRHLARAWGRDKGFHMVLAQFICERHGDVERKGRQREKDNDSATEVVVDPGVAGRRPPKKRRARQVSAGTRSHRSGKRKKGDDDVDVWDSGMYDDVDMLNAIFDFNEDDIPKTDNMETDGDVSPGSNDLERKAAIACLLGDGDDDGNVKKMPAQPSMPDEGTNRNQATISTMSPADQNNTNGIVYAPTAHSLQQRQEQHHSHETGGVAFATTGGGDPSSQLGRQEPAGRDFSFAHEELPQADTAHINAIDLVSFANSHVQNSLSEQPHQHHQLPHQQHPQQTFDVSGAQNFDQNYAQGHRNNQQHSSHGVMHEERVPDHVASSSDLQLEAQGNQDQPCQADYVDVSPNGPIQTQPTHGTDFHRHSHHGMPPSVLPTQESQPMEQAFANATLPNQPMQGQQPHFYEPQPPSVQDGAIINSQPQINGGGVIFETQQINLPDEASEQHARRVQRFMMEHPGEPVPSDVILRRLFNEDQVPGPGPVAAPIPMNVSVPPPQPVQQDYHQAQHQQEHSFDGSQAHHQLDQTTAYHHQQQQQQQQQQQLQWGHEVAHQHQEQTTSHFVAQSLPQQMGRGVSLHPGQPSHQLEAQQHQHQEQPPVYDQSTGEGSDDHVVDALDVHHAMHIEGSNPNSSNGTTGQWP